MHSWLAKNLIFPLHEALLERPTLDYVDSLEKSQWLSRERIVELQQQKLTQLVDISVDHCPWHAARIRDAGIRSNPNSTVTLEDLRKIPTMSKQDIQLHGNDMVWREVPGGIFKYTTGGSSGNPLNFFFGKWRQASDAAGRIRARRWWGIELGDKEVYLWGAPVELAKTDSIKQIRDRLMNQYLLNAFEMSPDNMRRYLNLIKKWRPACIYGYASSLALLAHFAKTEGIEVNVPDLKAIFTTGEPLYPDQRQLITEIFKVPVANEFGSRDIGFTAHETPSGQMLLMSESIILEVLDQNGSPVKVGETGEAVMTGLCSQAQPFIRYRTGDMIKVTDDECYEHRGLHVLGDVLGRSTDFIVKSDGTIMHALAVIYVLRALEGIEAFKVVQHTTTELEVLVVPNQLWNNAGKALIVEQLCKRLGDVEIDVNLVETIPAEKSGKHRYVVSHVKLPMA
ncbi:MAG: phenylacetate--CoA ligase family protein [Gammaproteobacteria bacterium]